MGNKKNFVTLMISLIISFAMTFLLGFLQVRAQCVDSLIVKDAQGTTGDSGIPVSVIGVNCDSLAGYMLSIGFDSCKVVVDSVTIGDDTPSGMFQTQPNTDTCVVAGWMSINPSVRILPGTNELVKIWFTVRESTLDTVAYICPKDGLGSPPTTNAFTDGSANDHYPELICGTFTIQLRYGAIAGEVTDAETFESIEGAIVTADGVSDTTDASGNYLIDVVAGTRKVVVAADGFEPDSVLGVVVIEDETTTVNFSLSPYIGYGVIEGTVSDTLSSPISGAVVTANGVSDSTDETGHYLIDSLLIGSYYVIASAEGYSRQDTVGIQVVEGETTKVDFVLKVQTFKPPDNLIIKDSLNSHILLEWQAPWGDLPILVVDDDGSLPFPGGYADVVSYFTDALDANSYIYAKCQVEYADNGPNFEYLKDYVIVIWFTGETFSSSYCITLSDSDEAAIGSYLDNGGSLFLSAQDYFRDRYSAAGSFSLGQFPYDHLQVSSTNQDQWFFVAGSSMVATGVTGSLAEEMAFNLWDPFTTTKDKDGLYIDAIIHTGSDLFRMIKPEGICALQYDSGIYKVIFTTLSFAALVDGGYPSNKATLMSHIIQFLSGSKKNKDKGKGCLTGYNVYRSTSPGVVIDSAHLLATVALPTTTICEDTNVFVGQRYYYRVTAIYEEGESDPSNEVSAIPWVAHNPEPFSLISPTDGDTVWQLSATLTWHQTTDPDPGDTLTYSLFWDTESGFSHPDSLVDLAETSSVVSDLSDETIYWWKVKAVDTNTLGRWSDETFSFTTYYPEPPEVFGLIYPQDGDTGISRLPTLIWQPAPDPDTGDRIIYSLVYSIHNDFSDSVMVSDLEDTAYIFTDSLQPETDYYWKVYASDRFGLATQCETSCHFTTRKEGLLVITSPEVPRTYSLSQNYPNPFNPVTQIRYALPKSTGVKLTIYNILGEAIATLIDFQQEPGYYQVVWDGRDELGRGACSGIYFYRLKAGDFTSVRRMVLIR